MTDLAHVLRLLPSPADPDLLAGRNPADDAAVYRLRDDLALVQTVDFFTPVVDDPYLYGQIAAANSLSDVYAMGGTPLTALNVLAFPTDSFTAEVAGAILRGGADKAAEAGVTVVGGHTVDDSEPKYGMAVTGTVHPQRFLTAHGARPGDRLVLTKPLGTGTIATALKAGQAEPWQVDQAARWMTTLNRDASLAMLHAGAHAATDITGYGLIGHLLELCRASGVGARISANAVPLLPGALESVREGLVPGGTKTNLDYVGSDIQLDERLDADTSLLLADPQTSGGLLVALPPDRYGAFVQRATVHMLTADIGEVVAAPAERVLVVE